MVTLEFIADQFAEYADTDPVHWNEVEGCIMFDTTPVFYTRFPDHFVLDVEGTVFELPR